VSYETVWAETFGMTACNSATSARKAGVDENVGTAMSTEIRRSWTS